MQTIELNTDVALGVTIPARHARGRVARIGPVLDAVLANHNYPPVIEKLLAEALVLTALLGSLLKDPTGQTTLQAQTDAGIVDLLVCDYLGGELRGYVRHDPERLAEAGPNPSLFALFGKGYLAITFDQAASKERYQGIVPLEGGSLAEAVEHFFDQSEQLPSLIRLAVGAGGRIAGGILLQHMAEGEEGRERLHARADHPEWEHVRVLAGTIQADELADPALPFETLVWRLFHEEEEIRILATIPLSRGCRCSSDYIRTIIARFAADERAAMADGEGFISVDCEFCSRVFPIRLSDVED
jgi:molecular chaperone Hsp33